MKKIFLSLMALVTAVMLVACGSKVDLEKIVSEMKITYAAGDSSQSVTKDITLPTADVEGAKITWSSNNAAITIQGNKGIVNRGAADVNVTLTVKATFEGKEATETFVVIVKKVEDGGNGGDGGNNGGDGGNGGNTDATLVVDLDFTTLTENTSYTSTLTDTTVVNKVDSSNFVVQRLFSNISAETNSGLKGLVLAIRKSTFESPILQTKAAINGLSKIQFTMYNWNNDASFNQADFLDKFVVEVSTDGSTWTLAEDVTSKLIVQTAAQMDITVNLATAGNYFVRIMPVAKTGIVSTYQLRYIFTSLKLFGTSVGGNTDGGNGDGGNGDGGNTDGGNTGGETPVGDAAIVFDFASTTLGTSYSSNQAAAKTIQNTVNSSNINVVSTRVASNNNHGTYKDPFLVMSASTKDGNNPASIEMNLGMEVKSMSFDAAFWSDFDATQTTKLEIQVLVDGVWTKLFDVKAAMSDSLSYVNIVVNNINASSIRIYAEGTAPTGTGNNGARVLFDNMKFFA